MNTFLQIVFFFFAPFMVGYVFAFDNHHYKYHIFKLLYWRWYKREATQIIWYKREVTQIIYVITRT